VIKNGLPPIHPGKFLKESLEELGISQVALARGLGVAPLRISHVLKGTRPITAELALRLGRALGQSPQYWLNLQADFALKVAIGRVDHALRSTARPICQSATQPFARGGHRNLLGLSSVYKD